MALESVETNQHNPEEIGLAEIKKRTISGVAALTFRTFVLQIVGLASYGIYSALFVPGDLGTYALVSSVRNFLSYFSDIGLAGALIQKKETPTTQDLNTTFIVQQSLVVPLVLILFFSTGFIQSIYHLSTDAIWLLWALGVSFFLSSLRTIPTILMERNLQFGKLIIPQIADNLVFNILVVYLASNGFGISSFTWAVLAQSVAGLVITYLLKPWVPSFSFSRESLKGLLKFGVPYQANTLIAVIKDDGLTLVLAGILGVANIGLLSWAQKWGLAPLRFFMDQVIKVTFPAFSRLQDNKQELENAITRSIFFICFLVFPAIVGLIVLSPLLIEIVPRYSQWKPALFALSMFGFNAGWAAVSTPLTNVLNAIGKIKITFRLMIMWTVLTWILVPGLSYLYGLNGAAIGYALVGASSIIAIAVVYKIVSFNITSSVIKPLIGAVGMGIVLFLVRNLMPPSVNWVLILVVFGLLVYTLSIILLVGQTIISDGRKVIYAALGKK
jgi:O-antigen/teichoic acid export membrane protein